MQLTPAFAEELHYMTKASAAGIRTFKIGDGVLAHTSKTRITHAGSPAQDILCYDKNYTCVSIISSLFPQSYPDSIPPNAHYLGLRAVSTVETVCGCTLSVIQYYVSQCLAEGYSNQTLAAVLGPEPLGRVLMDLDAAPKDGNYADIPKATPAEINASCIAHGFLSEERHNKVADWVRKQPQQTSTVSALSDAFGSATTTIWISEACKSNVMGRYARCIDEDRVQLTGISLAKTYGDFDIDWTIIPSKTKNYMGFEVVDMKK